jgi:hypothetical protein
VESEDWRLTELSNELKRIAGKGCRKLMPNSFKKLEELSQVDHHKLQLSLEAFS